MTIVSISAMFATVSVAGISVAKSVIYRHQETTRQCRDCHKQNCQSDQK